MGRRRKRRRQKKKQFWCFYCDRRFQDEKVLMQHQRSKHFRCEMCGRKLTSASGLKTHTFRLHRKQLEKVPNAKSGRDHFRYEIFGMEGIPSHFLKAYVEGNSNGPGLEPPTKRQRLAGPASASASAAAPGGVGATLSARSTVSALTGPVAQLIVEGQLGGVAVQKPKRPKKKVFYVFDHPDMSMEELRAELPRYEVLPRSSNSEAPPIEDASIPVSGE